MACKNCAAMNPTLAHLKPLFALSLVAALLVAVPAQAEKADRSKPMVFTFDKQGSTDLATQVELIGNVVITQGTMLLQADRVNAKQTPDGYWQLFALSPSEKQVNFRQARDTPGEFVEGVADQVDYDTKADSVRFAGNAVIRIMRGSLVTSQTSAPLLVCNNRTGQCELGAGDNGRGRLMILPRDAGAAAAPAAPASAVPLQPSITLQPRKPS